MTINTNQASNTARATSNDMLDGAEKAIEATRGFANEAIDKAGNKVRDMRGSVDPLVDQISQKVQQLANRSAEFASDAKGRAQEKLSKYADVTGRYVAEQPMKSVMIAAATGAAIAALIVLASRSNDRNRY
ncbi:MAG: hypothetical protein V4505_09260 [Pseudomonadota bacterium]